MWLKGDASYSFWHSCAPGLTSFRHTPPTDGSIENGISELGWAGTQYERTYTAPVKTEVDASIRKGWKVNEQIAVLEGAH